ncbi:glycosyltransferase [Methylomonas paludis]|uniref:Glycosyltransferase n=1 Tax=Methylomonas paludis TaxID=1173101 RepID=A0A975MNU1_9GAMM|nr:MJ1255/VC2487 family glycosyltransferase [Methylomonas paludis]QWF71296.1 glycosyltransferase [Methylomonas paludis]
MKIFYGVQGTGNGHITRARVMAKELQQAGFDVSYQFSGRPAEKYFDMEIFNGYRVKEGLTFNTAKGQVSYLKTALQASPVQFYKDISTLDLSAYDLIISDFEPVTAWAARKQRRKVIGIGHQYAFGHNIPRKGSDPIANQVMKYFAPATTGVGLHWHHFGQPILPPIIETPEFPANIQSDKIVVYLPFEDPNYVLSQLSCFENFEFHVYSPEPVVSKFANIVSKPLSRAGFQKDLYDCAGIISNAGFELASEALQLGKKILVKPLHSQMEQISNAAALEQLGYGRTMYDIQPAVIEAWLHNHHAMHITYPNVAKIVVEWLQQGMVEMDQAFIDNVWESVQILPVAQ